LFFDDSLAIGSSCPIRLDPTYLLRAIEIRLLGRFILDGFKTERLVCENGQTDGQTNVARSTHLVMLIKYIYTIYTSDWNDYTLCKGIKW